MDKFEKALDDAIAASNDDYARRLLPRMKELVFLCKDYYDAVPEEDDLPRAKLLSAVLDYNREIGADSPEDDTEALLLAAADNYLRANLAYGLTENGSELELAVRETVSVSMPILILAAMLYCEHHEEIIPPP